MPTNPGNNKEKVGCFNCFCLFFPCDNYRVCIACQFLGSSALLFLHRQCSNLVAFSCDRVEKPFQMLSVYTCSLVSCSLCTDSCLSLHLTLFLLLQILFPVFLELLFLVPLNMVKCFGILISFGILV